MNIKISIKDCDCVQGITTNKQFSQVQHKKKTMLYAPPQSDKNTRQTIRQPPRSNQNSKRAQNTLNTNTKQYRQSQQQLLNQLKKNGTNRATVDMVQNSNMILQKQNQILQQNQRAIHQMVNKNNKNSENLDGQNVRNQVMNALDQIQNQVIQIKKMRSQIASATQDFNKNLAQAKNGKNTRPQISNHISDLNSNMKNLVQVSQNHLEGLQNMQAIKNLQNFNIQGYTQAINTLKKQIAQYQKQSQNIQRQLKIRSAKLQKLQLPPKFQQQLYKPYQQHLNNRIKNIDLHAIRQKIYDKIGGFDYGKFQIDVGNIMIQAREEMANFNIICKQHAIVVPDIRIDQKQLKNLDIKLPSVLDQYKATRGIKFDDPKKLTKQFQSESQPRPSMTGGLSKTNQLQARLKQTNNKKPANLRTISTKPVDLAHQAPLTKQSDKRPTILQNENKKQKRQLQQRLKKSSKQKKKQDEQFEKYLQNRARQQLQILYKQQKQRLQKMQNQLYHEVQNPVYIDLNIRKEQVQQKKHSPKKHIQEFKKPKQQNQQQQQYGQQFQQYKNEENKRQKQIIEEQPNKNIKNTDIKELGRDILKQKLKNLLGQRNKSPHITHPNNFIPKRQQNIEVNGERQIQNIAEGFMAMINNTLTQVNNNLAKSIQKKIELNQDRKSSLQRKEAKKIQVPKLQSFRPPPVFNLNLVQQPNSISYMPVPSFNIPQQQKKIVVQSYDQYKLHNNDNYDEYEISSQQDGDDI